jgi:hypothetical protein
VSEERVDAKCSAARIRVDAMLSELRKLGAVSPREGLERLCPDDECLALDLRDARAALRLAVEAMESFAIRADANGDILCSDCRKPMVDGGHEPGCFVSAALAAARKELGDE